MRPTTHEIYGRRRSRNVGLGLTLGAFVLLVFMVTIVKLQMGYSVRGVQLPASMPVATDADHIPSAAERRALHGQGGG
jgi:hypothetical protein